MYKTLYDLLGKKYTFPVRDESVRREYLSFDEFNQLSQEDQEIYITSMRLREYQLMGGNRVK